MGEARLSLSAKSGAPGADGRFVGVGARSGAAYAPPTADAASRSAIDQSWLPVFQQDWWLAIARREGNYHEALVVKDHALVGSLPYVVRRTRIGIWWGAAPAWSHLGGPVVSPTLTKAEKLEVLGRLIAQLPANVSYGFVCSSYGDDAGLIRRAFADAGFTQFTETTYSQGPSEADVLERLKRKHRLHLDAAAKTLDIIELGEDEFIDFYSTNLAAAALTAHLPLDTARALIAAGRTRVAPQVRTLGARRKEPGAALDSAIACAWDEKRYYYWMSTRRRGKSHPDAIKLLILHAMAHARSLGLIFDTDGCSTPGSRTLYKDLLRIPNEEFRDVFERVTKLQRWYVALRQGLDKFAFVRFAKRKLKLELAPAIWVPGRAARARRF